VAHDDHFHCFAFPSGVTPGPGGSAKRTDTWLRVFSGIKLPMFPLPVNLPTDLTFYSLTDDLKALVTALNGKLAGSAKVESLGQTDGKRDLWVLKIGAGIEKDPKKARVLFTSGLHAREWLAPTYTYLIAEWLVTNYPKAAPANDMEKIAKDVLDNNHVWFVPMCNPDGHEYTVTTFRMHRKNSPGGDDFFRSAPGATPKRDPAAADSTDLNRNFDTKQWNAIRTSGKGDFSVDVNDENFEGATPASATETKLLQKMIDNTAFDLAVDHHTFDCAIMFPYGDDPGKAKEDKRLRAFTAAMQKQINGKAAKSANQTTRSTPDTWRLSKISDFYATLRGIPADESRIPGSITDYIIYVAEKAKRKTVAFAMELPPMHYPGSPGFTPQESIIQPAFRQLIGTSLALIKNATSASPKDADFAAFDKVAP